MSTGPFTPQRGVVGKTTKFPVTSSYGYPYIGCAGPSLCLTSTPDGLYATTDPTAGRWSREVAPSSDIGFYQIACPTVSFCAVAAGSGVLVSRSPAVASSWSLIQFGPYGVQAISCPTTALCVAGGFGTGTVGGWLETSTNPGDASAWHGHETNYPPSAEHSGQYAVSGISCPTTAFCVAATVVGPTLVSTDPVGGIGTWTSVGNDTMPSPGTASCTTGGACAVSGVGTFTTSASAAGPGIVGFPSPRGELHLGQVLFLAEQQPVGGGHWERLNQAVGGSYRRSPLGCVGEFLTPGASPIRLTAPPASDPPDSAEPGVDWPPEARGRWPSLSPPVHLLSPNQDRSRPSGDPAEVRHGRPFDLAARRRPAQDRVGWWRIHIEAQRPEGICAVHEDISHTLRLGEPRRTEASGARMAESISELRDWHVTEAFRRLAHGSVLFQPSSEGRRPPSTKASPRHLAQGGRARRAPSSPSTTRLSSTPSRRAFRSGWRSGDAAERSLGPRLQIPSVESYKPACPTGLGAIPVRRLYM